MNGNFMTVDKPMVEQNEAVYGSNRVNYIPMVMGICGNMVSYAIGRLVEQQHQRVNYDLTQKFPVDKVSEVLKSTQTELPQVTGAPRIFQYLQHPEAVEFIRSNMNGVSVVNINTGIIKELLKKWDYQAYIGVNGNVGLKNNPGTVSNTVPWADYNALKTQVDAAVNRLKAVTSLTTDEYADLNFTYTAGVAGLLSETNSENISNREKLQKAYPGMVFREIPAVLESAEQFYISYRPMLTFHHASVPGVYNTEAGDHGLSDKTLYTFESVAVEIEEIGAVQQVIKS